jgi:peptidyl-prolyl cis-trans isomerase C
MIPSTLKQILSSALLLAALLSACSPATPPINAATATPFPTPAPPTATPIPLAAIVNGEGVTQAEFAAELARFQSAQEALGNAIPPEEAAQRVLDDLINQVLLAQGAQAQGFSLEEAEVQARVDRLAGQAGGPDRLAEWQAAHGYSDASFRLALRRQILAAWMRDAVIAAVPETAEQVHIRQILLYNADTAQQVWAQLQSGMAFDALAAQYDPATQGELGWLPRGYLLQPAMEAAAFALQAGQFSEVIQTSIGYHILLVIERDPGHPLAPDARLALQNQALADWLHEQRARSTISLTP